MLNVVVSRISWRKWKKGPSWIMLALCCWSLINSCASVGPVVKIGIVGPFEGRNREIGYDVIYSARLAIREINESGGIGRYRVALVALDDFGDPEMARQTASAMVIDPGVVAVIGHWLPETTESAFPVYQRAKLPFVAAGNDDFGPSDPSLLPMEFQRAYAEVTPFDEAAGPYAGGAYDAIGLVLEAIESAAEIDGVINRDSVGRALNDRSYEGLTGKFESVE